MSQPSTHATTTPRRVLAAALAWLAIYGLSRLVLASAELAEPLRLAAAFAPLFAFYGFVAVTHRAVRDADELQRRIQLEALALAFPTSLLVLMTLGLMDMFHDGRVGLALRDMWVVLPVIYAASYAVARYRYR